MQTFLAWAYLSLPAALAGYRLADRQSLSVAAGRLRRHTGALLLLGVLFLAMQYLTLRVFALMQVAYALSLFQLGALVNVFFGYRIFREEHTLSRSLAGTLMVAGAVVLILKG